MVVEGERASEADLRHVQQDDDGDVTPGPGSRRSSGRARGVTLRSVVPALRRPSARVLRSLLS